MSDKKSPIIKQLINAIKVDCFEAAIKEHWIECDTSTLSRLTEDKRLFIYSRPEFAIAAAMSSDSDPEVALRNWSESIGRFLKKYRSIRRQSILIEAFSGLRRRGGGSTLDCESIELALATLMTLQSSQTSKILAELTASSIPIEGWDRAPQLPIAETLQEYRGLLTQIDLRQATTPQTVTELNEQKAKTKELLNEKSLLRKELSVIERENNLLLSQQRNAKEELEQSCLETKQLHSRIETITTQLKKAQSENAAATAERSKQTRRINNLEDARQQLQLEATEAKDENTLLLSQLHLVQEELEQYYFKNLELKQEIQEVNFHRQLIQNQCSYNRSNLKNDIKVLKKSQLFDEKWYLKQYPDVGQAKMNPYRHFILYGAAELRNPGPDFNTEWYLRTYPDVAEVGMNPLLHYILHGEKEHRMMNEQG